MKFLNSKTFSERPLTHITFQPHSITIKRTEYNLNFLLGMFAHQICRNEDGVLLHTIKLADNTPDFGGNIQFNVKDLLKDKEKNYINKLFRLLITLDGSLGGEDRENTLLGEYFFYKRNISCEPLIKNIEAAQGKDLLSLSEDELKYSIITVAKQQSPFKGIDLTELRESMRKLLVVNSRRLGEQAKEMILKNTSYYQPYNWPDGDISYMTRLGQLICDFAEKHNPIFNLVQVLHNRTIKDNTEEALLYPGRLGCEVKTDRVVFTVQLIQSTFVQVNIYSGASSSSPVNTYNMQKIDHRGIWQCEVPLSELGKLDDKYYTYYLEVMQVGGKMSVYEIIDPQARFVEGPVSFNANHHQTARARIANTPELPPPVPVVQDPNILPIISELHVQDMVGGLPQGSISRLIKDSRYIEYLKALKITHVQLNPLMHFNPHSQTYDWGYTFNGLYFAPSTYFSASNDSVAALLEIRELVDTFHKAGIKVIFDIVLHTTEGCGQDEYYISSLLATIGPRAFRFFEGKDQNRIMSNGAGCGNELKTESPFIRELIKEALSYWLKAADLDGYRFDLLALFDVESFHELTVELKKIKEDILIIGEPWTAENTPIWATDKGSQRELGIAVFNDYYRNTVAGNDMKTNTLGFIQGNINNREAVINQLIGSIAYDMNHPTETVNYVACHDGYTLWDKINMTVPEQNRLNVYRLASSILLLSQGVTFIQGGQEILRSKNAIYDTYNSGIKINKINYPFEGESKDKEEKENIFRYYQELIAYRKKHLLLNLRTREQVLEHTEFRHNEWLDQKGQGCIYYLLKGGKELGDSVDKLAILINPYPTPMKFKLEGSWTLAHNGLGLIDTEKRQEFFEGEITVDPGSAYILEAKTV